MNHKICSVMFCKLLYVFYINIPNERMRACRNVNRVECIHLHKKVVLLQVRARNFVTNSVPGIRVTCYGPYSVRYAVCQH